MKDTDTGESIEVSATYRRLCYARYAWLIDIFEALERGLVTLSLQEYSMLPATFNDAWRMYRSMKSERRSKDRAEGV